MTEPVDPQEEAYRTRRRGCIIRMILAWLGIGAVLITGVLYVRSHVSRDSEAIAAYVDGLVDMQLSSRFKAYSKSDFLGTVAIAYWNQDNIREDGRTLDVISFYQKHSWRKRKAAEVEAEMLPQLKEKLGRNEFFVKQKRTRITYNNGKPDPVHAYEGQAQLDDKLVDAASCFRYIDTKDGVFQVQTLGLVSSFSLEEQCGFLASLMTKE